MSDFDPNEYANAVDEFSRTLYNNASMWSQYYSDKDKRKDTMYMFEKQLDWNSPKSQMERYREAGLNPFIGHAISAGNMDSIPDTGEDPLSAVSSGLSRAAQLALERINTRTTLKEAKLREEQVTQQYEELLFKKQLFPIQYQIAKSNLDTLKLQNDFLNDSYQYRLDHLFYNRIPLGYARDQWFSNWAADNGQGYELMEELYRAIKSKNDYTDFLKAFSNARFDYQKDRDSVLDQHWEIMNNPFGFEIGNNGVNMLMNFLFQILNLFK